MNSRIFECVACGSDIPCSLKATFNTLRGILPLHCPFGEDKYRNRPEWNEKKEVKE